MADITPDQWIAEEELAQRLGVDREKIRAQRTRLLAGEVRLDGKTVMWLKNAARRVATELGLEAAFLQKNAAAAGQDAAQEVEELTVVSSPGPGGYHFHNHHVIRARRANDEVVVVRVVDSRKYLLRLRSGGPMTLRAQRSEAGNWWVLVGREPRWPGQW